MQSVSDVQAAESKARSNSRCHALISAVILSIGITPVGMVGCSSGPVRNSQPPSSESPASSKASPTVNAGSPDTEFKQLQERRLNARPSESADIIDAFSKAEEKYPNDYRFPYERAKLSIKGIVSHHEAFSALFLAGEKAIDGGKAQEMLDSLTADKDGDFYKMSRGHHEWMTLEEALRKKDKTSLKSSH